MPNWAIGSVNVTGTKAAVKAFADRFIYGEEPKTPENKRFFARSFHEYSRAEVNTSIEDAFEGAEAEEIGEVGFPVSFAWSAYSCLLDGYPQRAAECIELGDACIEDGVSVCIETSEPGICFEEFITCSTDGDICVEEREMKSYKCRHCGEVENIASYDDPETYECCRCGKEGFDLISKKEV